MGCVLEKVSKEKDYVKDNFKELSVKVSNNNNYTYCKPNLRIKIPKEKTHKSNNYD